MTPECLTGALHRAVNRFLDRIQHRIGSRDRIVMIENGHFRWYWKPFNRTHPQFHRLMRLHRRLHGNW